MTSVLRRSTVIFQVLVGVALVLTGHAAKLMAQMPAPTHLEVVALRQPVIVKLFGAGAGSLDSYGTGILVSKEGHVLTVWNHLVSTGFLTAVTADGRRFPVDTIGTSAEHDAALLKLKTDPDETFPFVDLAQATGQKWVRRCMPSRTCFESLRAMNLFRLFMELLRQKFRSRPLRAAGSFQLNHRYG
ncbi:MAG: serine protease [Planctomycetaceae bacterium]